MNRNNRYIVKGLTSLLLVMGASCKQDRYPGPLTPEKAMDHFELKDGFTIDVFAAEPEVADPVSMVFDANGNAFVVEMHDYPFMPENGKGSGRIKMLKDTDGDGRVDKVNVFADSILNPTSMLPWKGGLIVTAAPNILYLKDADGDFRADQKEVLFTGFFDRNSEAQITSLNFGIDNWIYAANNGQAGTVHFTRNRDVQPLEMAGSDFRFRLDRGKFELETGNAQFGLTLDDWGHRFITQNTLHIRQVVIPWRYLHRHPNLRSTNPLINISDHDLEMFQLTPPPYWRAERTRRRQKQYADEHLDRVEYAEDHFTGSSGGMIYEGNAFPSEYYGNVFTGDVSGNLVHRDVLIPLDSSPVYAARRAKGEEAKEFLASKDPWFRPASFAVGPDGLLYVVDMYRQHIETPLSIPEDLKTDMDFMNGADKGRIYRIMPEGFQDKKGSLPMPGELSSAGLVRLLSHPGRWWRLQAQRLLLERQDVSVVPALEDLFEKHEDARVRLHALYALEGLNALNETLVKEAMDDVHPGVRCHGLILAERYPVLRKIVLQHLEDPSIQVVLQATLSAGQFSDPGVTDPLAKAVLRNGKDPWIRLAVLSSVAGSSPEMAESLLSNGFFQNTAEWKIAFLEDYAFSVGKENQKDRVRRFLNLMNRVSLRADAWQLAAMKGMVKGLEKADADAALKDIAKGVSVDSEEHLKNAFTALRKYYGQR